MAEEDNWYYTMGGQQQGPVPLDHLKHWLSNGQLQPTELVWREGMANWLSAEQVPELQGIAPPMSGAAAAGFQPQQPAAGGYAQPINYQTPYYGQDTRVLSQVSKARSAMICGIIGVFGFCCGLLGLILGPIAIIQASQAFSSMKVTGSEQGKGMATAGMVLGIIDIVFVVIWFGLRVGMRHF
jgi:hypothetical protein